MGGDGMNTDDRIADQPGPNNNNQSMQFDNETIKLEVSGFDQSTNMNDVIGFLKSKKQFHYKEVRPDTRQCRIITRRQTDDQRVRLNKASTIIASNQPLCSHLNAAQMHWQLNNSLVLD